MDISAACPLSAGSLSPRDFLLSSGYGRYSASMTLYQAAVSAWEQAKLWLPAVADWQPTVAPKWVDRQPD